NILNGTTNKASSFLLFLVVIHVATALALLFYYRKTWWRLIKAWFRSIVSFDLKEREAKLAWLLVIATIPAGLIALALQSKLQDQFAKPLSAIVFLTINGIMLLVGDQYIRNKKHQAEKETKLREEAIAQTVSFKQSVVIGIAQVGALFAGISRTGITMVGGVFSGLNRDEAAEFSFLMATPIILAAGLYKLPSALSHKSAGMHGEMLVGAVCAAVAAYFAVRFLDRYFKKSSFRPFGIYCIVVGILILLVGLGRGHF
ncbi:MAG TPA: undecaprenyl-diphosphate phosphatase, partial [Candidatus Saccharimonadales bacterium]